MPTRAAGAVEHDASSGVQPLTTEHFSLEEALKRLPDGPGAYLFRDKVGKLLYVGKAGSLASRVPSHFSEPAPSAWNELMVKRVAYVDWVVTDSELEALILENNLIKEQRPFFNIRLSDDATYPYLKLTLNEEFPRLLVVRRVKKDGARYFGPYGNAGAMRKTMKTIRKVFRVGDCPGPRKDGRPCFEYQIGQCLGHCVGAVTKEQYADVVRQVILFLEGKAETVLRRLRTRMESAAEELKFEEAARIRDQVLAIESVCERQKMDLASREEMDVVAVAFKESLGCAQVFSVREGRLVAREKFDLKGAQEKSLAEVLSGFFQQYYSDGHSVPRTVVVEKQPEEREVLEAWLSDARGGKVSIVVPQRGAKRGLLQLAARNAELSLQTLLQSTRVRQEMNARLLQRLQEYFSLPELPVRIEAYDVSTIQGVNTVGSMVTFLEGVADKKSYRMFRIKNPEAFRDDYAALKEVLGRRLESAQQGLKGFAQLPHLILIDGGKGQLRAAREAMEEAGCAVPSIGIAKKEEKIYTQVHGEGSRLPAEPELLRFFQRVRDEAHRFALSYHVRLRAKGQLKSLLDQIPGVGPERKRRLIGHFKSFDRLLTASREEIGQVPGIDSRTAEAIFEFLRALSEGERKVSS